MKNLHPFSFIVGLVSGIVVLFIFSGTMRFFFPAPATASRGAGGGTLSIARMAKRLGMTQDALQKELDSGKTPQQIAQEHGVSFGGGRNRGSASGATVRGTGSGASTMSLSSTASAISSSSSQ